MYVSGHGGQLEELVPLAVARDCRQDKMHHCAVGNSIHVVLGSFFYSP